METRTDEVKKGMFLQRKTPHGAYIKAPQASEPQTLFTSKQVGFGTLHLLYYLETSETPLEGRLYYSSPSSCEPGGSLLIPYRSGFVRIRFGLLDPVDTYI